MTEREREQSKEGRKEREMGAGRKGREEKRRKERKEGGKKEGFVNK